MDAFLEIFLFLVFTFMIPSLSSLWTVSFSSGYKRYRHKLANLVQLDATSSLYSLNAILNNTNMRNLQI
jgi:hypothetical protein